PVITVIGLQFGFLLSGAVVTESIFSLPGMGRLLVQAILARDLPIVQGAVLLAAVTSVLTNLLVDLVYGMADPRIRFDCRHRGEGAPPPTRSAAGTTGADPPAPAGAVPAGPDRRSHPEPGRPGGAAGAL